MNDITKIYSNIQALFATYGLKILGAILFLLSVYGLQTSSQKCLVN